jgi:arylsulfatase A-like enzyme
MSKRLLQKRWPWITAGVLVIVAYLSTWVELRPSGDRDERPRGSAEDIAGLRERADLNILFLVVDTLRAERLSAYGYARETSPLFDLLAERGVRFGHHLAQSSWTKSSMASLWTGLYPVRSGITRFDQVISQDAVLPAELLRDAGFRTVGLYRNGWVAPSFGFDQGFEVYERPLSGSPPPGLRRDNPTVHEGGTDEDAVNAALEFLRVYGRERWFLYLHLMDVHEYTYDEESARFGSSYSDIYDNAVLRTNLVLDRLFGEMAKAGQLERTLVVLLSDHGEAFGERGSEGHARNLYREVTEVPWLISFPFRLDPGVVVSSRTSNVDVWPTLLDLIGLPPLPVADGRSRVPEILAAARGEAAPADASAPTFAYLDQRWGQREALPAPTVSVVDGPYRFVQTLDARGRAREELFDATGDASEQHDLMTEQPEHAARLRALADAHRAESPAPWAQETQTLELDELQLNQLRALGYAIP